MKNKLILILLAILFSSAQIFGAVEINISERDATESRRFDNDYIFKGEKLSFSGKARDLFFFASQMDFSGKTDLALNGLAENVTVTGNVNNGVKAAARNVVINGNVTGTSFLAGADIILDKHARVTGDTFIGARRVAILGTHKGDMRMGAAEISIQNVIEGDVIAYTGQLEIGEEGRIVGNLTYYSEDEISPEEAARVTGKINFQQREKNFLDEGDDHGFFKDSIWPSVLFKISFIIFGLLLLLIPVNRFLGGRFNGRSVLSHALWGLIPVFVYPSAFVISILLIITLPVAAVLLLSFIPVVFVTKVFGLTIIGGYLAEVLNLRTTNRFLYLLLASVPYILLSYIPFFGWLLMVFVSSIGCGWMLSKLFNRDFSR